MTRAQGIVEGAQYWSLEVVGVQVMLPIKNNKEKRQKKKKKVALPSMSCDHIVDAPDLLTRNTLYVFHV